MQSISQKVQTIATSLKDTIIPPGATKLQKFVSIIRTLLILKALSAITKNLLHLLKRCPNLLKRYGAGSYVVITGSTDGIGKALAFEFAKLGFNIVLISRSLDKLTKTGEEIKEKYPTVLVKIVQADFTKAAEKGFFRNIYEETKDLDISILVNNVGIDCIELFCELSEEFIHNMLSINVYTATMLTRLYINKMAARKRSAVITMGSLAGQMPISYFNVYCATKAFTQMLSLSLAKEHTNIDFLSIRPSEVSTGMTFNKPLDIFTITAPQCTASILKELGRGSLESNGHWNHCIQEWLYTKVVPPKIYDFVWNNFIIHDFRKQRNMSPPTPIK
jgi:17beta-estradiol 17-dehydrogenase / very-long-chain 3-oxoacyl-CoA reductase